MVVSAGVNIVRLLPQLQPSKPHLRIQHSDPAQKAEHSHHNGGINAHVVIGGADEEEGKFAGSLGHSQCGT